MWYKSLQPWFRFISAISLMCFMFSFSFAVGCGPALTEFPILGKIAKWGILWGSGLGLLMGFLGNIYDDQTEEEKREIEWLKQYNNRMYPYG